MRSDGITAAEQSDNPGLTLSPSQQSSFTGIAYGSNFYAFMSDGQTSGEILQSVNGGSIGTTSNSLAAYPWKPDNAGVDLWSPMAASWSHPLDSQVSMVSLRESEGVSQVVLMPEIAVSIFSTAAPAADSLSARDAAHKQSWTGRLSPLAPYPCLGKCAAWYVPAHIIPAQQIMTYDFGPCRTDLPEVVLWDLRANSNLRIPGSALEVIPVLDLRLRVERLQAAADPIQRL